MNLFQLGDEEAMSAEEVDEEQNNGVENSQELTHHANWYHLVRSNVNEAINMIG